MRRVAGDGGRSYARLINAISRLEDESARSSGYSRRHSSSGGVIDRVYEQPRSGAALRVGDDADSGSDGEDPIYVPLPPPEAQTAAQVIYAPLPGWLRRIGSIVTVKKSVPHFSHHTLFTP